MRRIESRSNPLIVRIAKLTARKEREAAKRFFFEGAHLLEEYLRFGHLPQIVFVCDGAERTYAPLLRQLPAELLCQVPEPVFAKLTTEQAPQGLLTVSSYLPEIRQITEASQTPGQVLLLQSVRDNGNVGTAIRSAAALGWSVVVSSDCADLYAPKTVRASMGTLFAGSVFVCDDPVAYVRSFHACGRRVYAATLGANSCRLGTFPLREDDGFVVGNEGQGVSAELADACGRTVLIPMTDRAESLNASIAASIIMWEGARSRG